MRHLRRLADAGLNTVHLLPVFDIATIEERRSAQQVPDCDLASLPRDSEQQQECIEAVRPDDGFNWGYDPLHYTAPEGSYATDPDGTRRTVEFRRMVQGLNGAGLQVVMDVVYNHTAASGQDAEVGARPDRAGLLPPPRRQGRGRDLHVLLQHRDRAPHDGEADDRLGAHLGA